jgi:putative effector of murein hydrolase
VSSHIVSTDWLTRRDPRAGGLSALAFVMTGIILAGVVPLFWRWLA